jgi:hypothetical protein
VIITRQKYEASAVLAGRISFVNIDFLDNMTALRDRIMESTNNFSLVREEVLGYSKRRDSKLLPVDVN